MQHRKHYGFNFQWMFSWDPDQKPEPADEKALDFLAESGFNFVRIPLDYRFWTCDFDYFQHELSMLLEQAGFQIEAEKGDWTDIDATADHATIVYIARK